MIDARRWILVEAWLSCGLRLEWCPSYEENRISREQWMEDEDGNRFYYAGNSTWRVADRSRGVPSYLPRPLSPSLHVDTLKHELAHWLIASGEQRNKLNFGFGPNDDESNVLQAEAVIDAMLVASSRFADLAMNGGRR